jgi:hypothetical protein
MAAVLQLLSSILSALLRIATYTALCLDILVVRSPFSADILCLISLQYSLPCAVFYWSCTGGHRFMVLTHVMKIGLK